MLIVGGVPLLLLLLTVLLLPTNNSADVLLLLLPDTQAKLDQLAPRARQVNTSLNMCLPICMPTLHLFVHTAGNSLLCHVLNTHHSPCLFPGPQGPNGTQGEVGPAGTQSAATGPAYHTQLLVPHMLAAFAFPHACLHCPPTRLADSLPACCLRARLMCTCRS